MSRKIRCQERKLLTLFLFQAKLHGHEPSRGAQVDKEIADEEAEMVAKKDAKKK